MKIEVNNIELFYKKEGEGYPLILIHGSGEDHHIFDKLAEKLKKHFTIYAFDSRNHGESSKTSDYTYDSMAKDYCQAIEKLNLEQPYLVGFSDGAIIGVLIETEFPNTFRKMALLGLNMQPSDFEDNIIKYVESEYEKSNDPLLQMMLTQPSITSEQLSTITTSSLVIFAENDLFRSDMIELVVRSLPNSALKIMEGHDHESYIINEDILYSDLISFFNA